YAGLNNVDSFIVFFFSSALAVLLVSFFGRSIGWMFKTWHIPELLKSPDVFVVVIFSFTLPDELVHGTGLLSVTAMGMTLANAGINSLNDFRHFKENVSLLLISAIFIMLASSLNLDTILHIF